MAKAKAKWERRRLQQLFDVFDYAQRKHIDAFSQDDQVREAAQDFDIPYLALWLVLNRGVRIKDIDKLAKTPIVDRAVRKWLSEEQPPAR